MTPKSIAADSSPPWRAQLFGPFQVDRNGLRVGFRTKKTAGLLAYMAFYLGRPIAKDVLVDVFWSEHNSTQGRQSLRMALSSLRSALTQPDWDADCYIRSDRDTVELTGGVQTDVGMFSAALESAKREAGAAKRALLRQAVDLYSGQLLYGFGEPWILNQGLELEERYAQAVRDLVSELGAEPDAADIARRALTLCPTREDLHIALMQAHGAAGHNSLVLRQFEELERMLDEMWGETPGDEAVSVLDSVPRRDRASSVLSPGPREVPVTQMRSAFFGRQREIEELVSYLRSGERLVTLIGLGGSGKTRLAQRLLGLLGERAWFVSFVGIDGLEHMQSEVMSALKVPAGGGDPFAALAAFLGDQPAVLVLDNLEHVIEDACDLTLSLLNQCPTLQVLATSRTPIGLGSERLFPVPPLPLPNDFRDLEALRESPSVQLLVDAAQSVRPGFSVLPANAKSVLLLVQRLEGIPLAIELAAAKLGTLSPAQLIGSIGRRVDLATSRQIVREQHRSLRMVLDWSLGLLTDADRTAFAALGVCRGGFTMNLAQALLGESAEETIETLSRCSLIKWEESGNDIRFSMLETVREVSLEWLDNDDDAHRVAHRRHFDFVDSLINSARTPSPEWLDAIAAELVNILAAVEAAASGTVDPLSAWRMVFPLQAFIDRRGGPQVWIGPLSDLLSQTEARLDDRSRARAHILIASTQYGLRNIRSAYDHYVLARQAADRTDEVPLRIACRADSISVAITLGEFKSAEESLNEAIAMLPDEGGENSKASCYLNLAWLHFDQCDEPSSLALFQEALRYAETSDDPALVASTLVGLGCAIGHADYDSAQPVFDQARDLWSGLGRPAGLAHSFCNRAMIDYRHGRLEQAHSNLEASLRLYTESGIALGQTAMTVTGTIMAARGDFTRAVAAWGRAEAARRRHQMQMIPFLAVDYHREMPRVSGAIPPKDWPHLWTRAINLPDIEFVELLFD